MYLKIYAGKMEFLKGGVGEIVKALGNGYFEQCRIKAKIVYGI